MTTTTTTPTTPTLTATTSDIREIWSSRAAFLLAAIGATVGFGNVWRFPAVVHGT